MGTPTGNRLGEFLRARREQVQPGDHGMPAPLDRRTPGLRREDVAALAGVSTGYYVRLEQGRERNPSPQTIDALADALRLDADARSYLHGLVRPAPALPRRRADDRVGAGLVALIDSWHDTPALIMNRWTDVLAANPLARGLYSWILDSGERNLVRAVFLDPAARDFYPDWEYAAANVVGNLRLRADGDLDDPRLTALVGELSLKSAEFARLWSRHDVRRKRGQVKTVRHPVVGELELDVQPLTVDESPGHQLVVYRAEPGSRTAEALALLGSLVAHPAAPGVRQ
jgi:transcriptional regulator with XRE-family HTH domain